MLVRRAMSMRPLRGLLRQCATSTTSAAVAPSTTNEAAATGTTTEAVATKVPSQPPTGMPTSVQVQQRHVSVAKLHAAVPVELIKFFMERPIDQWLEGMVKGKDIPNLSHQAYYEVQLCLRAMDRVAQLKLEAADSQLTFVDASTFVRQMTQEYSFVPRNTMIALLNSLLHKHSTVKLLTTRIFPLIRAWCDLAISYSPNFALPVVPLANVLKHIEQRLMRAVDFKSTNAKLPGLSVTEEFFPGAKVACAMIEAMANVGLGSPILQESLLQAILNSERTGLNDRIVMKSVLKLCHGLTAFPPETQHTLLDFVSDYLLEHSESTNSILLPKFLHVFAMRNETHRCVSTVLEIVCQTSYLKTLSATDVASILMSCAKLNRNDYRLGAIVEHLTVVSLATLSPGVLANLSFAIAKLKLHSEALWNNILTTGSMAGATFTQTLHFLTGYARFKELALQPSSPQFRVFSELADYFVTTKDEWDPPIIAGIADAYSLVGLAPPHLFTLLLQQFVAILTADKDPNHFTHLIPIVKFLKAVIQLKFGQPAHSTELNYLLERLAQIMQARTMKLHPYDILNLAEVLVGLNINHSSSKQFLADFFALGETPRISARDMAEVKFHCLKIMSR